MKSQGRKRGISLEQEYADVKFAWNLTGFLTGTGWRSKKAALLTTADLSSGSLGIGQCGACCARRTYSNRS
jgi:hypothetical protein